jgi:GT2 family glycosyltransferase
LKTENCISVVIATKDRTDDLKRFLDSLDRQTLPPGQVVVVDAGNEESTAEMIQARKGSAGYPFVYLRSKPGLTGQRNIGIEKSSGRYICFFDDDIVLDAGYLEAIHRTFEKYSPKKIGGVVGRIENGCAENHPIESVIKKIFFLSDQGRGRLKPSGFPEHRNDSRQAFVNVFSGCCMAYCREVFNDFQFDEKLSGYCYMEDIDFSFRVSQKFRLLYQPEAICRHYATTYKTEDSRALRYMLAQNHLYLFRKNLPKDPFHLYAFVMSLFGLLLCNAVLLKDISACKGIIKGLLNPLPISDR